MMLGVISATPDAPMGVTVIQETPTMLVVSVEPPDNDGGVPIIGYRLTYLSVFQDFAFGKDKLDKGNMFYLEEISLLTDLKICVGNRKTVVLIAWLT